MKLTKTSFAPPPHAPFVSTGKLPLKYYRNNLTGTFNLVEVLSEANCKRIVFSSSATVYGTAAPPLSEESQVGVGVTNPYGKTKYFLEEVRCL